MLRYDRLYLKAPWDYAAITIIDSVLVNLDFMVTETPFKIYPKIIIACLVLAAAQAAHFFIYFEQPLLLSIKWSIKGSILWFLIFAGVIHFKLGTAKVGQPNYLLYWIVLTVFVGALHVAIAVSMDALLGTADRRLLPDFLHLYNKRWLQNSLIFVLFVLWWRPWHRNKDDGHKNANSESRLRVSTGDQTLWLDKSQISHIESLGNYVCIYINGQSHIVRHTLKALSDQLSQHGFLRVSRSAVVNPKFIDSYHKPSSNKVEIVLTNSHTVAIGRTYWQSVKAKLGS